MKSSNRQRTLLRQAAAFVFGLVLLILAANEGAAQATNVLENTGNAGIGTLTPTQPLEVVGSIVTSGSQTVTITNKGVIEVTNTITNNALASAAFKARHVFNGSGDNPNGADIVPTFLPTANLTLARGMVVGGRFAPPSGVTIANVYGANAVTWYDVASGSVTAGTTFFASSPIVWGALKPTTQYGLRVANQGISGTTNSYGLYVDAQAGSTNNYAAIFADGNVGIGTTSPSSSLDVVKNQNANTFVRIANNDSGASGKAYFLADNGTSTFRMQQNGTGFGGVGATLAGEGVLYNTSPALTVMTDNAAGIIKFATGGSGEKMRLDATGKLGIGKTNPAYLVDVAGAVNATAFNINGSPVTSSQWSNGSGNINYTSGNVGIGTANPFLRVQIQSSAGSIVGSQLNNSDFILGTTGSALYSGLGAASGNTYSEIQAFINGDTAPGSLILNRQGGNVGIGTGSPVNLLDVSKSQDAGTNLVLTNANAGTSSVSNIQATSNGANASIRSHALARTATRYGVAMGGYSELIGFGGNGLMIGTGADAKPIIVGTNGTERMRIDSAGNVGIGKTNPEYSLDVAGTVNATEFKIAGSLVTSSQWASGSGNINYTSGNVGIGTSSPNASYKLDVNGAINATGLNVSGSPVTSSQWSGAGTNNINYSPAGNVGIGNPSPTSKLDVSGNGHFTGNLTVDGTINAKYQDVAEWVPSSEQLSAGTVVVLDQTKSNQVISSTISYDTRVAGVISAQPGIALGESGAGKVLVATTGRVRVKVDATRAPIQIGDLLVTSDVSGVAMKSQAVNLGGVQIHRPGTIIGKALEPLAKGSGEILVLLSLQ